MNINAKKGKQTTKKMYRKCKWHHREYDPALPVSLFLILMFFFFCFNFEKCINENPKSFLIVLSIFDQKSATSTFLFFRYFFFSSSLLSFKKTIWFIRGNKIIHCFFKLRMHRAVGASTNSANMKLNGNRKQSLSLQLS